MFNSTVLCALVLLLSALMLHYFVVIEENFQPQRTSSRRPGGRARARRQQAQEQVESPPNTPAPAPSAAPATAPAACPPCPTVATTAATATPVAPGTPTPPAVAPASAPPQTADLAKVDQATAPARAPVQPSMPFSELVNSLITYKPIQDAQLMGQPQVSKNALDGTALHNIDSLPTKEISRDVKKIRMGVKDIQNILKSDRNEQPIVARTPTANSDALQQGNWFRSNTGGGCPYAMGQQPDCQFRPVDDMNDYIRKDSIPCWGCTLK